MLIIGREMAARTCMLCGKALSRIWAGNGEDFCSREHRNQYRLRRGMDRLLEANKVYAKVPGSSPRGARVCLQALAVFYTMWDKAEPAKGYDIKAVEWKSKLDEPAPSSKPTG